MQGPFQHKRSVPMIDLDTVKDTLAYIRDDLARVPGLEGAAGHLSTTLGEIAAAERRRLAPIPRTVLEARRMVRRKH